MEYLVSILVVLIIIVCCIYSVKRKRKECQEKYNKEFQVLATNFYDNLNNGLINENMSYEKLLNILLKIMDEIKKIKEDKLSKEYSASYLKKTVENHVEISRMQSVMQELADLCNRVNSSEDCYMMISNEYGRVNRSYYNRVTSMQRAAVDAMVKGWKDTYEKLADLCNRVNSSEDGCIMITNEYGRVSRSYGNRVTSMQESTVDAMVKGWKGAYENNNYKVILNIHPQELALCVWFYASYKPFSAEDFNEINKIYRLVHKDHITNEVFIAELFSIKQMGGNGVIRTKIQNYIKENNYGEHSPIQKFAENNNSVTVDVALTNVASALMWMNAYDAENIILEYMLERQLQMPAKLQERLHSLSNGGGKAPDGFDVKSDSRTIYFDVSAITWKDDEYRGLFENLAFQEKILTYSLAIRDEDKELFATQGFKLPNILTVLSRIKKVFADEYGSSVVADTISCIALSGSGRENLEGILVQSRECNQLGIFVHMACIGKKLNIKFYTLFMPIADKLAEQRQQVISMQKKMSPNVTMWENSIKDTILLAVQQILNDVPPSQKHGEKTDNGDNGETVEF